MQRIPTSLEPLTPAQETLEFFDLPDSTQQPLTLRLDLEARAEALTVLTAVDRADRQSGQADGG
jgi:hypothetical protein